MALWFSTGSACTASRLTSVSKMKESCPQTSIESRTPILSSVPQVLGWVGKSPLTICKEKPLPWFRRDPGQRKTVGGGQLELEIAAQSLARQTEPGGRPKTSASATRNRTDADSLCGRAGRDPCTGCHEATEVSCKRRLDRAWQRRHARQHIRARIGVAVGGEKGRVKLVAPELKAVNTGPSR